MKSPWDLYLRFLQLLSAPDMTVVEVCSGTSPAARAAAFLGLNSISFDNRKSQIQTATANLASFFTKFKEPVSLI